MKSHKRAEESLKDLPMQAFQNCSISADAPAAAFGKTAFADFASARYKYEDFDFWRWLAATSGDPEGKANGALGAGGRLSGGCTGKEGSDAFYRISATEREKILELARSEKIDGILAFASDSAAPTAAYVAEKLHLPGNPLRAAV